MISENILHMKRVDFLMLALLMLVSSCSDKFQVVDPAEPVPVIYFMMNPLDRVFYLTLSRTFTGDLNAYELAGDPDRVFYDSADIRLEAWEGQYKVQELQFSLSDRVKDPGYFPQVPGYCYKADVSQGFLPGSLSPIDSYRIIMQTEGMAEPAFARVEKMRTSPVPSHFNRRIDFYPDGYKYPPDRYSSELKHETAVSPGGIAYQQFVCEFHYQVYEGTWTDHAVTFTLRKNLLVDGGGIAPILYADFFFSRLAAHIDPISDTITRRFISLNLVFLSADKYYKDYIEAIEEDGNMDLPPKGNIINGYGLFSMFTIKRYEDMVLGQQSLDSLSMGQFTRHLGFVRW